MDRALQPLQARFDVSGDRRAQTGGKARAPPRHVIGQENPIGLGQQPFAEEAHPRDQVVFIDAAVIRELAPVASTDGGPCMTTWRSGPTRGLVADLEDREACVI